MKNMRLLKRLRDAVRPRWEIADEASEQLAAETGMGQYDSDEAEERFSTVRRGSLSAACAYVQDGSQYTASLWTMPDFFCALFSVLPEALK